MYINDVKIALDNSLNILFNEKKTNPSPHQPAKDAIVAPRMVYSQQMTNMAQHQPNINIIPVKVMEEISRNSRIYLMDNSSNGNGSNISRRMT